MVGWGQQGQRGPYPRGYPCKEERIAMSCTCFLEFGALSFARRCLPRAGVSARELDRKQMLLEG